MIFCSYRSEFKDYFSYLVFNFFKKLNALKYLQLVLLYIAIRLSADVRYEALYTYIKKINGANIRIKNLEYSRLRGCSHGTKYDFLDLHNISYIEESSNLSFPYFIKPEGCIYRLPRSGFFSTILTAINVSYLSLIHI